jgi:hypothetical protein
MYVLCTVARLYGDYNRSIVKMCSITFILLHEFNSVRFRRVPAITFTLDLQTTHFHRLAVAEIESPQFPLKMSLMKTMCV